MEEETKKIKEIELRSEEVQEVMEKVPFQIVRWGITVIAAIVLILLVGSYFFKYPDMVVTEMILTGRQPVAQIVARSSGKINELYAAEGESVKRGTLLGVLENSASTQEVRLLKNRFMKYANEPDSLMAVLISDSPLSLGDVQGAYSSFLSNVHEYINFRSLAYYPQKIEQNKRQIRLQKGYYQKQEHQLQVMELQHTLARQQYARDSLLFIRGLLSASDHETALSALLQSQLSVDNLLASLDNLKLQMAIQESTLLDLELGQVERENLLFQSYCRGTELLRKSINDWELSYCLISPIDGIVTFTTYWNVNQYVSSGEKVFTVIPEESEEIIGKAYLPIQRSGKVKTGQRVIIRFDGYPDQEFGVVYGEVHSVSLAPMEGRFTVEITLPEGLESNYGILLPVSQEITASAEIVTEELRLIERLMQPVKKIIKEGF